MGVSLGVLGAVTLFVEDLEGAREFYARVFDGSPVHQDEDSVVFDLGGVLLNVLDVAAAPELVTPLPVGDARTGPRFLLTLRVVDVDAAARSLGGRGVELLNGPVDRPWGVRTLAFADPAGHVWELAQPLGA